MDYNWSFLLYTFLIMAAEVWMLWLVYQDTNKAYFLAISPLRWLSVIIVVSKYEELGVGFFYLLFLVVALYWVFINLLVNMIVLKKPVLHVGTDGLIGASLNNWFGSKAPLLTLIIKLIILLLAAFLFYQHNA